ncbi:MAG: 4-vinyl reductase, partial [Lawsonibacter sp.]|nr:4-vinyl reductase [Lawsonibacter sp.]
MANIFSRSIRNHNCFCWGNLGDIRVGRGELGETMPVLVYRLMEYCLNDVLIKTGGQGFADDIFRKAGYLAGTEFAKNVLDLRVDFDTFISDLQQRLIELKIGILRFEQFDAELEEFFLTVAEDLDCSGLPPTNE